MKLKQLLILNLIFIISILSIMGGVAMNKIAIKSNYGKMPVLSPYSWSKSTHFTFQEFSEVKKDGLVDRYQIGNHVYSLGDFVIFFGVLCFISIQMYVAKRVIKGYKKNKNEER